MSRKILTSILRPANHRAIVFFVLAAMPAAGSAQGFRTEAIEGRIHFAIGPTYNRIEGLPLTIGPIIQTRNEFPLRFSALTIIRTENDPARDFDQVGFLVAAEKDFGNHVAVGVSGWSRLKWVEERGISNLESSLSTALLHDDRRDYYDALGIGVHGRFVGFDRQLSGIITFRHERLRPVRTTGVTSLINNGDSWRSQAIAAEGTLHSMKATFQWDSRPEQRDGPFNGWFAELDILMGLGGTYTYPTADDPAGNPFENFLVPDREPIRLTGDVRKYFALGEVEINLRGAAGGSITNRPLPAQFQYALGGSGTLPGLPAFHQDCGARGSTIVPTANSLRDSFFPYYGCDRFLLLQAEIAGYFGFAIGNESSRRNAFSRDQGLGFRLVPQWVVFANAGQGWSLHDGFFSTVRDEEMLYDAGLGIVFGDIGGYAAYPLNSDDPKVRFTIRIIRRI